MLREERIAKRISEHFEEACKCQDNIVLGVFLQGSQNYELDIDSDDYKSDIDSKAILIPRFDSFVHNYQPISHTHILENEEHVDLKDIRLMFDNFKKQNVNFMEILFTKFYKIDSDYKSVLKELRDLAPELASCHPAQALKTMVGLSMEKRKALTHPYPSIIDKIKKYGYDGKQLHHIIRINDFMEKYSSGIPYSECLVPKGTIRDLMIEAKLNHFSLEEAENLAKEYDEKNKKIKEEYISKYGEDILTVEPYKQLDEIRFKVLKESFKKEILNGRK